MPGARFIKQVEKELPDWQAHGWITADNGRALVEHLKSQASKSHLLAYGVALLGVILLGSGVITWFAANWAGMAKITKLCALLGSLYAAYGAAAWFLAEERSPKLGQALLLLGVILFGANIMLIAQIYHIDAHYPDGVLTWAIGGLLTAYLLRSQPALVAAIGLGVLWSGMESFDFDEVHWAFLPLWFAFLPAICRWRWLLSLSLAMRALFIWSVFVFFAWDFGGVERYLYLVQIFGIAYFAAFTLGMLMETEPRLAEFTPSVLNTSLAGALLAFLVLTFPDLQDDRATGAGEGVWVAATFAALAILVGLAVWHRLRTKGDRPRYLQYAVWLVGAGAALIVMNLFIDARHASLMAIAFNLLYFATMVWLMVAGLAQGNRYILNLSFFFFAAGLLSRYFDTFWTLLDRSFFFMAGGVILIVGGYFLEQQRRKLAARIGNR